MFCIGLFWVSIFFFTKCNPANTFDFEGGVKYRLLNQYYNSKQLFFEIKINTSFYSEIKYRIKKKLTEIGIDIHGFIFKYIL